MSRTVLRILALGNVLAFLAMVTTNALANIVPINGVKTGAVSAGLPNYFVPAGFTFSIWGLIYLLLGIWAVWQLIAVFNGIDFAIDVTGRIGPWFLVSSICNLAWILAWHHGKYSLSLILMLLILFSLIALYLRLDVGRLELSNGQKALAHWPFSVYLGWITVATVANVTALLVYVGWDGFGITGVSWALIMIFIAAFIILSILLTRRDVASALVLLWAFSGIVAARLDGPMSSRPVVIGTIVAGAIVLLGVVWTIVRKTA